MLKATQCESDENSGCVPKGVVFVVPLATVEEVIELEQAQVFGAPAPRGKKQVAKQLRRHGENIPLF